MKMYRVLAGAGLVALVVGASVRAWLSDNSLGAAIEGLVVCIIAFCFAAGLWSDDSFVPREFRDLPLGIGTLRVVARTKVDGQFDLTFDVVTADGRRFTGTQRIALPDALYRELRPGTEMPVHHHASGDTRVAMALDSDQEEVDLARMRIQVVNGTLTPEQANAAQFGVRTTAQVVEFEPTGELRAGCAVVQVTLRVRRPDGTEFTHVSDRYLGAEELPYLQEGCTVQARYLPGDEDTVVTAVVVPPCPRTP